MIHLRLQIKLTLIGPILTQATNAGAFGIDAMMARDRLHQPYLPYSLVRGKLRQALEELQDALNDPDLAANINRWFGPRSMGDDFTNQRGTLFFDDFVHPSAKPEKQTLSRIQMNRETHAVKERMLMVIDTPFGYGERAGFEGKIRGICTDLAQAEETVKLLRAGLQWMTQLGADRTVGFGRVHTVELEHLHLTELTPQGENQFVKAQKRLETLVYPVEPASRVHRHQCAKANLGPAATHYAIRLRPNGPFCFGGNRQRSNIFESETIIPGNVLLGALASTYCMAADAAPKTNEVTPIKGKQWQTLAANFGKLRFTHAFPCVRGGKVRPAVLPLSLVVAEPELADIPDCLHDVALCARPRMIPHQGRQRPPVFSSDWKSHLVTKIAKKIFGWPDEIHKELRVRTAIDVEKLRAEEEKLFAYEMIVPDGLDWLATLDLSRVAKEERGQVLVDLQQLLSAGLGPLGKTKIDAEVWIEPLESAQPKFASDAKPLSGNRWVITLQTPAILCASGDLRWSSGQHPGEKLLGGYQRVFAELSGNTLRLERFFAKQSLSNARFAGRLPRDGQYYYPFILTDEGSTFVFKLAEMGDVSKAQDIVQTWLHHGIPLARTLASGFGPISDPDWKKCPILDRHGFGEITVNSPWLCNSKEIDKPIKLQD